MLPPKNIGIFGEYPDHDDPAAQLILESMLKVVLDQFERVYGDDSPDA